MPTYVYDCPECGHRFELRQSFQSDNVAPCPKCEAKSQRVILSVPVVFKGSGFYVNDYGKKGSTSQPASDNNEDKKPSAKMMQKKIKSLKKIIPNPVQIQHQKTIIQPKNLLLKRLASNLTIENCCTTSI